MATEFTFDGKTIIIPGTHSRLVSGVKNQPVELSYGTALFIDTGSGAGYGGGAGINGVTADRKDAFYEFDNLRDFQNFVGGNLPWLLATPLFKPAGSGIQGLSKLIYVRAARTTPGTLTIEFVGDGTASVSTSINNGGSLTIRTKYEGLAANGALSPDLSRLSRGFGVTMEAGIDDTAKFVLKFWRGAFTGNDANGFPHDGIAANDGVPILLATSEEFNNIATLITWMQEDFEFNGFFELTGSAVNGTGAVDQYDLLDFGDFQMFTGGTETFGSTNLDDVLEDIVNMDFSFILCDRYGTESQHGNNFRIAAAANDHKYEPEVYIASQDDRSGFALSKADCVYYDNENTTVVHGAVRISKRNSALGYRVYPSIYKAAGLLGREAGRPPQVPLTNKNIAISGEEHALSEKEAKQALKIGLLVTWLDNGKFICIKGVNSLQKNTYLLNEDGTTHSKQLRRMGRQLNKEIIINSKAQLLDQEEGVNRNTLSEADVKTWLFGYLKLKTADSETDNLVISQRNITVTRNQDLYDVEYEVVMNTEISFILFTGKIVDL